MSDISETLPEVQAFMDSIRGNEEELSVVLVGSAARHICFERYAAVLSSNNSKTKRFSRVGPTVLDRTIRATMTWLAAGYRVGEPLILARPILPTTSPRSLFG
jgi:hypothetical protein